MLADPKVKEFIRERFGNSAPFPNSTKLPVSTPAYPYGNSESTLGYQAGSKLYDAVNGKQFLRPVGTFLNGLGRNNLSSALTGAGIGGLIGAGSGITSGSDSPGGRAVMGAGLGAGAALLLSKLMESRDNQEASLQARAGGNIKRSFYGLPGGPNPSQFIQTALFHDMHLAPGDKSMLIGMLPNLNPSQAQNLSEMLRGSLGAGAGMLIARYLFKLGLGGQALLALVGGAAGSAFGANPRNAYGQRVNTRYDSLGRQRLVF